jgi:hypothetical protein
MQTIEQPRLSTLTEHQLRILRANEYCKWISCLHESNDSPGGASELYALRYPRSLHLDLITKAVPALLGKAAVNPGTTLEPGWAAPLSPLQPLEAAIVELARPMSLLGKIDRLVRAPFNVSVPVQTGGGTYRWTGQGAPAPVGNLSLSSATLPILTASGIIVVTQELLKLTSEASVAFLRNELVRGIAKYVDEQLTDPTVAAVSGTSPASITNGAPSIASAGTSAANALTDIKLSSWRCRIRLATDREVRRRTMTPLSLDGCTRSEAESRVRTYIETRLVEHLLALPAEAREFFLQTEGDLISATIDRAMKEVRSLFDREWRE